MAFDKFEIEKERERLRKLNDKKLIREGKAGRHVCSACANFGTPPRDDFVIRLRLIKEEWRRRHPKEHRILADAAE